MHPNTRHRSCAFYLAWFTRCYIQGEAGWNVSHTPDNCGIMDQDAFFWLALETIASTLNTRIALERAKTNA